jgi:hypothetical protein
MPGWAPNRETDTERTRWIKALIAAMGLKEMRGPFIDMLHQAGFELVYPPGSTPLTEEELLPQLQGVRASVAGPEPYTRRVIEANPSLTCGSG